MKRFLVESRLVVAVVLFFTPVPARAGTWTTINVPDATHTYPRSIDGDNVVGFYMTDASYPYDRGFLYDQAKKTWTLLDKPGAISTAITGICGDRIVGLYLDASSRLRGLIYNLTDESWIDFDMPGESDTALHSIDADNVVGTYSGGDRAFVYDLTDDTWVSVDIAGATRINPRGISGDRIVGDYRAGPLGAQYGFLYDLADDSYTNLEVPGAAPHSTDPSDIDGNIVVGGTGSRSFLYDVTTDTWSFFDMPRAGGTGARGIDGNNIVGEYHNGFNQGFIYTVPEPTSFALLVVSALAFTILLTKRKRR